VILNPARIIIDERVSEIVCHASAIRATEPVTIPAQYFRIKSTVFRPMEIQASRYA
jgi:hypothetical protein